MFVSVPVEVEKLLEHRWYRLKYISIPTRNENQTSITMHEHILKIEQNSITKQDEDFSTCSTVMCIDRKKKSD